MSNFEIKINNINVTPERESFTVDKDSLNTPHFCIVLQGREKALVTNFGFKPLGFINSDGTGEIEAITDPSETQAYFVKYTWTRAQGNDYKRILNYQNFTRRNND